MSSVSIIVPTLNEAGNIDPLLERIFKVRDDHALDLEVVFVDDASTDGTCDEIRGWQAAYPVRLVSRTTDDGLAGAVMAGARAAKGEYAVVMDADLSHPPEAIPEPPRPAARGQPRYGHRQPLCARRRHAGVAAAAQDLLKTRHPAGPILYRCA